MTDKEREANEMVEQILRELRAQRQGVNAAEVQPAIVPQAAATPPDKTPTPDTAQKPDQPQQDEKAEPPAETVRPAVEEIFPEPKLPTPQRQAGSADDLIDDKFRQFFTTTVAVDRSEMKRLAAEPEKEKKKGFFSRLFAGRDEEEEYDEEDEYLEEDAEEDLDEMPPAQPQPDLPENIFDTPLQENPVPKPNLNPVPEPRSVPATPPAAPSQPTPPPEPAPVPQPTPQPDPAPQPVSPPPIPPTAQPEIPAEPLIKDQISAEPPVTLPEEEKPQSGLPDSLFDGEQPEAVAAAGKAEVSFAQLAQELYADVPDAEDTAAANEPFEVEEPTLEHEIPKRRTAVFEEEAFEHDEQEEEPIEDYDAPGDAEAVETNLKSLKASLSLRFTVTALISVFLLYITLAKSYTALPMLSLLSPTGQPLVYLGLCLLLTGICIAVNWPTVSGGVLSIPGEPNPDIAPAFAALFSLIQCVVFMTGSAKFAAGNYTPFCGIAALTLALNTLGKAMTTRIVQDNFSIASSGFDHAAAYCIKNEELTAKVTAGLGEKEPHLLVSRPTALVRGFLRQSFSEHPTDKIAKTMGIAAVAASVLCGIAVMVLTKDLFSAISCFAGAMCLATPLACTLVGAVPAGLMQSSAARVGAVIPGPSAVEELKNTNVVLIHARDLFPTGTIVLRGIKTFQKERIDLAILYAASVLVEGCETMRDVFLNVVGGKRDMLYSVENLTTETGRGFIGWIDGNRIIVGGRTIMQEHEIDIPSMDYERKYTGTDKQPIYLAVSGRLFGMFLVTYNPAPEMQDTVEDLRASGLSLLVRSTDFNITGELIADCYAISPDSVKVLAEPELTALEPSLAYLPSSEGIMTHIGSFASFMGGLHAALAASAAEHTAGVVEMASVLLALVLTALLTFTAGLGHLSVLAVLLYQLAWLILTLAVPLVKKY